MLTYPVYDSVGSSNYYLALDFGVVARDLGWVDIFGTLR